MRRLPRLPVGRTILWAALPALSALSLIGTALSPSLASGNPLLLVALAPRYPFLLLAAGKSAVIPFAVVAFVRLAAADAPSFLLARRHGHHLHAIAARWRWSRAIDAATAALFCRLGLVAVACSPTSKVLAMAGASPVAGWRVAVAAAAGTAVHVGLVCGAGAGLR